MLEGARNRSYLLARLRAQNVAEYGVLIATIGVLVLLGVNALGHQIEPWLESLAREIVTHT